MQAHQNNQIAINTRQSQFQLQTYHFLFLHQKQFHNIEALKSLIRQN